MGTMTEPALDAALNARTAPRVTKELIEAAIARVDYHVLPGNEASPGERVTICQITLKNGFDVRGESACVDARNFVREIGEHYAHEDAFKKLWPFFGFLLADRLSRGTNIHGIGPDEGRGRNPDYRGDCMDFGQALAALKEGRRVARAGWNGEGMFAYLVPPASYPVQTGAAMSFFGAGAMVPYRAYLALKTVDNDVATWTPSASDVLAEDWAVVDGD